MMQNTVIMAMLLLALPEDTTSNFTPPHRSGSGRVRGRFFLLLAVVRLESCTFIDFTKATMKFREQCVRDSLMLQIFIS